MIDRYTWQGGSEAMLRFGPADGPVIVAALPLLEEANRTRAFVVTILRELALRGIASALPDLPGQGESLVALETLSFLELQGAFADAIAALEAERRRCYAMGVRSGALLDTASVVSGRWHLAPQEGPDLLREFKRIAGVRTRETDTIDLWWLTDAPADMDDGLGPTIEIAGNQLSADFLTELTGKHCRARSEADAPLRIVRLAHDSHAADVHFPAPPLWRRVEPDNDPTLAASLAEDIAAWIHACEG